MSSVMEFHEAANLFPMMTGAEYEDLKASIARRGLRVPIVTYRGRILDGRNRYRACQETGIKPRFVEYDGQSEDVTADVISWNLERRHLDESQRAMFAAEMANASEGGNGNNQHASNSANLPSSKVTQPAAAAMYKVSTRSVTKAKAIKKKAPKLAEKVKAGEMTLHEAEKEARKQERERERRKLAKSAAAVPPSDRWNVYTGDIRTWQAPRQYDYIIADPPYPREYLPLYGVLAERAAAWLKPGGLLVAMCGQSYLPEIYAAMGRSLTYLWTAAYLTPGGQAVQLFQRKVNTFWKPLLVYCKGDYTGQWFGDVAKSAVNDNDKDNHEWGQSVSGMVDVVRRFCQPGAVILDPFAGAGTTGLAALEAGCVFDGLELDAATAQIARGRLAQI